MDFPVVRIRCRCNTCGKRFTIVTASGRSDICADCTDLLLEVIWGPGWRDICVLRGRKQ